MATDQEIALGPLVASSDDDAEQTRSARLPSWSKGKAALGVGVAMLLLGTLACFSQGGAARANAMDSMIQSRAVAEHGRFLTEDELVKVRGLVEKVPNQLRQLPDEPISEECKTAIGEKVADLAEKLLTLGLDAAIKCFQDGSSQKCKDAQRKVDTFERDENAACQQSGEYCSFVEHTAQGDEEEHQCVPEECHEHEDIAQDVFTDMLQEEHDNCVQCWVEVNCGD